MSRTKKDAMRGNDRWMEDAVKNPGSLHEALDVPMDRKIPAKKLEKALHSRDSLMRKRANLAKTFKRFNRSG